MKKLMTSLCGIFMVLALLIPSGILAQNELVDDPVLMTNPLSVRYQLTDVADCAIDSNNQASALGGGYLGVTITAQLGLENANKNINYLIDHPGASTLKPDRNTIRTDGNGSVTISSLAPNFGNSRNDHNTSNTWTFNIYSSDTDLISAGSTCTFSIHTDGQYSSGSETARVGSPANINLNYTGSRYVKYDPAQFTLNVATETAGFTSSDSVNVTYNVDAKALDAQGSDSNIRVGGSVSSSLKGNSSNQNSVMVTVTNPGTYQVTFSVANPDNGYQYSSTSQRVTLSVAQDDSKHQYVIRSISYWGNYNDKAYFRITKKTQQSPKPSDPAVDDGPSIVDPTPKPPVDNTVKVSEVKVSPSNLSLTAGDKSTLSVTVSPANATNKAVTWSSSNRNVASVDSNGHVTTYAAGDAVITATSQDGNKVGRCIVTVKSTVVHKNPESVKLSATSLKMDVGQSYNLVATILPADAQNQDVTWTTSSSAIAKVDNGTVMAVSAGAAKITARTSNGKEASCDVTVNKPAEKEVKVSSVSLDKTSQTLKEGDSFVLNQSVLPEDATNKNVTWKSSDEKVAVVTGDGKVVAQDVSKDSTAVITVTTVDGNKSATCNVKVTYVPESTKEIAVSSISLNQSKATIKFGETLTLNETISPSDATNKNLTWISSNDSVATVDEYGIVTAVNPGTAEIFVRTENDKSAKCVVTVVAADSGIEVTPNEEFKPEEQPTQPEVQPGNPEQPGIEEPDSGNTQPQPSNPTQPEQSGDSEQTEQPSETPTAQNIYRLYNAETGEHLYTSDAYEATVLSSQPNWKSEDVGWQSPSTGEPVYRLFNAGLNDHLYTTDPNEVQVLTTQAGWQADNGGKPIFYSGGDVPIYRLYNSVSQRHHLTKDINEYNNLPAVSPDWKQEGVAIHAIA